MAEMQTEHSAQILHLHVGTCKLDTACMKHVKHAHLGPRHLHVHVVETWQLVLVEQ